MIGIDQQRISVRCNFILHHSTEYMCVIITNDASCSGGQKGHIFKITAGFWHEFYIKKS